jgi:hypothetical protein
MGGLHPAGPDSLNFLPKPSHCGVRGPPNAVNPFHPKYPASLSLEAASCSPHFADYFSPLSTIIMIIREQDSLSKGDHVQNPEHRRNCNISSPAGQLRHIATN